MAASSEPHVIENLALRLVDASESVRGLRKQLERAEAELQQIERAVEAACGGSDARVKARFERMVGREASASQKGGA